ncbi:MAG: hypothetical protein QNL04_13310 [SAR324 cluster bacterium]|nr:hypothetical protein [SAR324 cluster bacterium]
MEKISLNFEPGDHNYQPVDPFSNPYNKRSLAANVVYGKLGPKFRTIGDSTYDLKFYNISKLYLDRNLKPKYQINPKVKREVIKKEFLMGNSVRADFLLKSYLNKFLVDIQRDRDGLENHANKLWELCNLHNFKVEWVESFRGIPNFDEFYQLIDSLVRKAGAFQFDLAVSAILIYANRIGPDY